MADGRDNFDTVVVGGGIYGVMLTLELLRHGQTVALLDRGPFGCGTTAHWLRILHGGLRYLQSLDLLRFFESVGERRWLLRYLSHFAEPLPCVMPLYNRYSRPRWLMRAGLMANDVLSARRNAGVTEALWLDGGRMLSPDEVCAAIPFVERDGLVGGAQWHDAVVRQPQILFQALLELCQRKGAYLLPLTEAQALERSNGRVVGVQVRSKRMPGRTLSASRVLLAVGHETPALLSRWSLPAPELPRPSWAWNVLLDVPNTATSAAAVAARRPDSQMLFVLPWRGRILLGTGHSAIADSDDLDEIPQSLIANLVAEADQAVPRLKLRKADVLRVYAGKLPACQGATLKLTSRPWIRDHSKDGAAGLTSIWGVKFTTAHGVAQRIVGKLLNSKPDGRFYDELSCREESALESRVIAALERQELTRELVAEFLHVYRATKPDISLRNLTLERTGIGDIPGHAAELGRTIAGIVGWSEERLTSEVESVGSLRL